MIETVDPDYVNRVNDSEYPAAVEAAYRRYWHLPCSVFLNGRCCIYGTIEDGFPILSRATWLANFYHAVGLNGHGMCQRVPPLSDQRREFRARWTDLMSNLMGA